MARTIRYRKWHEFWDRREPELDWEVYELKRNMVYRVTEAVNMRLGNSKSIQKEVKSIEENQKSIEEGCSLEGPWWLENIYWQGVSLLFCKSLPHSLPLFHCEMWVWGDSVCLQETCLSVWVLEWIISFSASYFIAYKTGMILITLLSLRIYQDNVGKKSQVLFSTEMAGSV